MSISTMKFCFLFPFFGINSLLLPHFFLGNCSTSIFLALIARGAISSSELSIYHFYNLYTFGRESYCFSLQNFANSFKFWKLFMVINMVLLISRGAIVNPVFHLWNNFFFVSIIIAGCFFNFKSLFSIQCSCFTPFSNAIAWLAASWADCSIFNGLTLVNSSTQIENSAIMATSNNVIHFWLLSFCFCSACCQRIDDLEICWL